MNINIYYKDVEEPIRFLNMSNSEIVKGGKFLYMSTDIDVEYYIPLENVLYWKIEYKEEDK